MQRRQTTLKEKLSDHYQKRDFKPKKTSASTIGMLFYGGMLCSLLVEGLLILIPRHYSDGSGGYRKGYHWSQFFAVWLFFMSGMNWWLTYFDLKNRVTKQTKEDYYPNLLDTPPGWKNCPTCMLDTPPRSHHCSLCKHCILKRDHHCFFTGSCIGFHNQRYFVIFCIYVMMSCSYASYMQIAYLGHDYPIFTRSALTYFLPATLWQFFNGSVTFGTLFIVLHLWLAIVSLGGASFFLTWQLLIIIRGQTSYEAWKLIMIYRRRSVFNNLMDVFGNPLQFLLILFVPIRLDMPGDGIKWTIEPKQDKGH